MFTGIVRQRGILSAEPRRRRDGSVTLEVGVGEALAGDLEVGASLAVSGVCLTVAAMAAGTVRLEVSPETLSRTTLGELGRGSSVNLEPALAMGDRLGGHWVQGHVDATTEVVARLDLGEHRELSFGLPGGLAPYLVEKGSVTVDGVSLTVACLDAAGPGAESFVVALVPHTLEVTTLISLDRGDRVNLEVDILAKYVRRALETAGLAQAGAISDGRA